MTDRTTGIVREPEAAQLDIRLGHLQTAIDAVLRELPKDGTITILGYENQRYYTLEVDRPGVVVRVEAVNGLTRSVETWRKDPE